MKRSWVIRCHRSRSRFRAVTQERVSDRVVEQFMVAEPEVVEETLAPKML